LHDAQLAIAKEQGFPSWPRFKAFIVESNLDFQGQVTAFIDAAVSDARRARALLEENPKIADAGFYVALVLGNWKRVERTLTETPALVNVKSGPQNCQPLLYVCFSRYASGKSDRAADLIETARVLLSHGADPNVFLVPEDLPDNPLPCLYAATGLNNNPGLAQALLEAGADPNDSESLYHSTEHPDHACMRLLLRHGATPSGKNALKHMLDSEDIEGLQLLLAAGANPNEVNERGETALHWAVWRGRSPETIANLLNRGADINLQRNDGRRAYAIAMVSGQTEVADFLRARGANTDVSALDQFVAASANAAPEEVERLLTLHPQIISSAGSERLLPDLAASHCTTAVRALLVAGVPLDARGEAGGTALHWACWKGYADLAKLLIEAGAPLALEDTNFHAPPAGWLHHGIQNCCEKVGDFDYAQVARLLLEAGAPMRGCNTPTGNAKVDIVLREHKVIE
jgi:ankyrin repeat protein